MISPEQLIDIGITSPSLLQVKKQVRSNRMTRPTPHKERAAVTEPPTAQGQGLLWLFFFPVLAGGRLVSAFRSPHSIFPGQSDWFSFHSQESEGHILKVKRMATSNTGPYHSPPTLAHRPPGLMPAEVRYPWDEEKTPPQSLCH